MTTLHLVFSRSGYEACTKRCKAHDPIVLLQDGVYADTRREHVTVLESDAIARGMHNRLRNIDFISMDQFVELTTRHKPVVSWP
jgi:sulfur relay protein TusB/DsrH